MERQLFVYWRVTGSAADAEAAARQLQHRLRAAHPSLVAQLFRKLDDRHCTLMEVYAQPGAGIDLALQQQIESAAAEALSPWCREGRHVEVFEDCS